METTSVIATVCGCIPKTSSEVELMETSSSLGDNIPTTTQNFFGS